MLDLQPIRARLKAATPGPFCSAAEGELIANAPTDLAALIEEVVRLRKALDHYCRITDDNEAYKSRVLNAIHKHRTECLLTGTIHERDTLLWDILDA